MNLEKIKQNISEILDAGGSVSFDYKSGMKDWYQTINIHYFKGSLGIPPKYYINNGPAYGDYTSKEEAIDKFVKCIFNENNLAYCLDRIKKKLGIIDFEDSGYSFDRPSVEFLDLIKKEKKLIQEELKEKEDPNEQLFILLQTGHKKVEEIMADVNDTINLEKFITDSSIGISNKIKFYRHMSDLFLNVLLNRIDVEFGKKGEEKAILCRDILKKNIEKLRSELI